MTAVAASNLVFMTASSPIETGGKVGGEFAPSCRLSASTQRRRARMQGEVKIAALAAPGEGSGCADQDLALIEDRSGRRPGRRPAPRLEADREHVAGRRQPGCPAGRWRRRGAAAGGRAGAAGRRRCPTARNRGAWLRLRGHRRKADLARFRPGDRDPARRAAMAGEHGDDRGRDRPRHQREVERQCGRREAAGDSQTTPENQRIEPLAQWQGDAAMGAAVGKAAGAAVRRRSAARSRARHAPGGSSAGVTSSIADNRSAQSPAIRASVGSAAISRSNRRRTRLGMVPSTYSAASRSRNSGLSYLMGRDTASNVPGCAAASS